MERYTENTHIGIDDFRRSEWRTAVDAPKKYGYYYSLWQSLSELATFRRKNEDLSLALSSVSQSSSCEIEQIRAHPADFEQ